MKNNSKKVTILSKVTAKYQITLPLKTEMNLVLSQGTNSSDAIKNTDSFLNPIK